MALDQIVKDGFSFGAHRSNVEPDLAHISLDIALKAYYSTYQAFKHRLQIFDDNAGMTQDEIDYDHSKAYCEAYAETIVHFQHFAELICKGLLRDDHPLLSDVALTKPNTLHKLLHGQSLTANEEMELKSIEFSEALSRLGNLIKAGSLTNHADLGFVLDSMEMLVKLNSLRNRIWHRGTFILRYQSLDIFVGKHILPFVVKIISLPKFKNISSSWGHNPLHCGIEPIKEIIQESTLLKPNTGKLAYLKELGRAAYENPVSQNRGNQSSKLKTFLQLFEDRERKRAERIANIEAAQEFSTIKTCPVCGVISLIIYDETTDEYDSTNGTFETFNFTSSVRCECCTFSMERNIENASTYNIKGIDDYWVYTKLS